jgi:hypothetical protein
MATESVGVYQAGGKMQLNAADESRITRPDRARADRPGATPSAANLAWSNRVARLEWNERTRVKVSSNRATPAAMWAHPIARSFAKSRVGLRTLRNTATMLAFDRCPDDWNGGRRERVQLDRRLVGCVRAEERWASAGPCPVAVIASVDADEYVVHDSQRTVATEVTAAKLRSAGAAGV